MPTPYKLRVGKAPIVKAGDGILTDPFGDGSIFYAMKTGNEFVLFVEKGGQPDFVTKNLSFSTDRNNAATFHVSVSQYGKLMTVLQEERDSHEYVAKKEESGSGVGRLQKTNRIEDAAMFTFTPYVERK